MSITQYPLICKNATPSPVAGDPFRQGVKIELPLLGPGARIRGTRTKAISRQGTSQWSMRVSTILFLENWSVRVGASASITSVRSSAAQDRRNRTQQQLQIER